VRNIFYWTQGVLFHNDGGKNDTRSLWDYNLYWQADGQPPAFYDSDFAAWQAKGLDRNGRVADPRFVDAANYDFRLQPDSPALALGFKPIDTRECGLVAPSDGRKWNLAALARKARFPATSLPPLPPPPPSLTLDDGFESTPVGQSPAQATVFEEGRGDGIRVTDECACRGHRCLKITDAPGLKHVFNPHLFYAPHFRTGRVAFAVDLRIEPRAIMAHEWRDSERPYRVGPSLVIDAQRHLKAAGRTLAQVPASTWFRLEIECELGAKATGQYDLVLTLSNSAPQRFTGLPCGSKAFTRLEWLGITSLANEKTVFYLDNLKLTAKDPTESAPAGPPVPPRK
jgi:hypothetical protein